MARPREAQAGVAPPFQLPAGGRAAEGTSGHNQKKEPRDFQRGPGHIAPR